MPETSEGRVGDVDNRVKAAEAAYNAAVASGKENIIAISKRALDDARKKEAGNLPNQETMN
jgi:hypothetical protein